MAQQEVQERQLLVDIKSAEGLKNVAWLGRMNPCAMAWVHPMNQSAKRPYGRCEATTVHQKGGRNPFWGQRLDFTLTETQVQALPGDFALTIAVMHVGTFGGRTRLGSVTIPIRELVAHLKMAAAAGVALPKVSIVKHLLRPSGRRQGLLNFALTLWPRLQEVKAEVGGTGEMHDMEAQSKMAATVHYPPVNSTWDSEPHAHDRGQAEQQQHINEQEVTRYPYMCMGHASGLRAPPNTPECGVWARPSGPALQLKPAKRSSGLMSSGSGALPGFGSAPNKLYRNDFGSFNGGCDSSGYFSIDIHGGRGSNSISAPELNSFFFSNFGGGLTKKLLLSINGC